MSRAFNATIGRQAATPVVGLTKSTEGASLSTMGDAATTFLGQGFVRTLALTRNAP